MAVFVSYDWSRVFDWSAYKGNLEWLPARTLFLTRHGSHAYGTNLPTSDLDLRGIAIAPADYYHGFSKTFEQAVQHEPDLTVFELRKFMKLAADANPNALEILFTDSSDHLVRTAIGDRLIESRDLFLSRRIKHTLSGYAVSQLRRIQTHHRWLKSPPTAPPTRAEFGLPDRTVIPADQLEAAKAAIQKKLDRWNLKHLDTLDVAARIDLLNEARDMLAEQTVAMDEKAWAGAARVLGFSDNFIELLDRERRYDGRKKEWDQFQTWKRERNATRAELEAKHGYDTKHAMHLVRLLRMCREVLTTGVLRVRRPDAAELLDVRAGAWTYEKLVAWAEGEDRALGELAESSPLPHGPDRKRLDALCVELVEASLG